MANILSPPITDPTGQAILRKLQDIKKNIHLPLGTGLNVDVNGQINVIPEVYSGLGIPEKILGKTGDIYIRYKWISQDETQQYVADIQTIYTKMPIGEIAEDDPDYNPWTECFSDITISSGTEEPIPETGSDGDIYLMYYEYVDEQTGETVIDILRFYQKIEDQWAYFSAGVPRDEFDRAIHKATHKTLVFYNNNAFILSSQTPNTYRRFLLLEKDFVMDNRSALQMDLEILMNVVCDPYTITSDVYTILGDTKVRVVYEFDYVEINYFPEQVVEDGPNVLSLHYPFSIVEEQVHNIKIYLEVMNGTVTIAKRGMIGNLAGTGIDADGFSGVMLGEDQMNKLAFSRIFASYEDDPDDPTLVPVVSDNPSDTLSSFGFARIFVGFSDETPDIDLEEPEEEEENA